MNGKRLIIGLACVLSLPAVAAAGIANANFEEGLSGWTVQSGTVMSYTDTAGTFTLLQDAGGSMGQARSTFYQDFTLEPGNASLSFEYLLMTEGQYAGAGALPDAFSVRLLDSATLLPLLSTSGVSDYFYHDTRGAADSIDFDSGLVTLSSAASRTGWFTVTLDMSGLAAGTAARLQFDLLGTGLLDGQMTFAGVDNVVVPAPPTALLVLIGVAVRWLKPRNA